MSDSERVRKILAILKKEYPEARTALTHKNAYELLISTILSAQCTDAQVNKVTPHLFDRYKSAKDLAKARSQDVEKIIRSTGFYKNKAKLIIGCARELVAIYGSTVPSSLEEMVKLPGVGRKTANVVLGEWFDIPGIVVDTHVKRLSNLLKLTKSSDPDKIEEDLMKVVPKKEWSDFSILLIFHGRRTCIARRPRCCECRINKYCPSNNCQ